MAADRSRRRERVASRGMVRDRIGGPAAVDPPLPMGTVRAPSERAPLPADAHQSPPLPPTFASVLDQGLAHLGLELDRAARAAIEGQARLLLAWGAQINLSAHRTADAIALEHVVDSLTAVPHLAGASSVLDLGSGAGYPGLPLAVTIPFRRVALVDSIAKKARFLEVVASSAAAACRAAGATVPDIAVVRTRAESLGREPQQRASWDVVTARAVAPLSTLVDLAFPLLRVGGRLVAWKRDDGQGALPRELAAAQDVGRACGAGRPAIHEVSVPGLDDHRLVVIDKRRATPDRFPSGPGARSRALLG